MFKPTSPKKSNIYIQKEFVEGGIIVPEITIPCGEGDWTATVQPPSPLVKQHHLQLLQRWKLKNRAQKCTKNKCAIVQLTAALVWCTEKII